MPFCLICSKHLKNKKASLNHEQSLSHRKNSTVDLKALFDRTLCSLIYKYSEFKEISKIYKEFVQKYSLTYAQAGYRSLEDALANLKENVMCKTVGDVKYVKGFENFIEEKPILKIKFKKYF
ncbi:hypothetical protein NGRA_0878 [Nosema granulosis]|uniref:Uncharacterized protein n=1 Tax=Nosema granulosis TaxID=83296 RepID=A0A9P6GZI6_9MICR|nr:hypothetical protein NGRA_0878 [Nosema granulosis]